MPNQVCIVVSALRTGMTRVVPYSHTQGLQFYTRNGVRTDQPVVYEVPRYAVRIQGGSTYDAVRFGLQNRDLPTPPAVTTCDAGLSQGRVCTPAWVPGYSPHSFRGGSRSGAWRLLPGQSFLIHEGADTTRGQVGGSLGCIEVLDGDWNSFLAEIERLANAPCATIGATGTLQVTIEASPYPPAKLIPVPAGR